MLSRVDGATAMFPANDHIGLGLLRAKHERGKRVPEDDIAWVRFGKTDAKLATMGPHLRRQAATGRSGAAAIGVAGVPAGVDGERG